MILYNPVRAGFSLRALSLACTFILLTACATVPETQDERAPVSLIKTNPKAVAEQLDDTLDEKRTGKTLLEQRGTGDFTNAPRKRQSVEASAGGVNVNFEGAPLEAVLAVILGDLLQVPYTLEGNVSGQITLVSTEPVPQEALLDMLESALEAQGIALVKGSNGIYRVGSSVGVRSEVPVALREAVATRGYSVRIIPLKYLSVLEAEKILTPLGMKDSILRVDPLRNILMLGASAPQMKNALRTLNMLDVDVLSGMSFGIYEIVNLDAGLLVERVEKIIGDPELGSLAGATKLITLDEINSVMVVAPNSSQLSAVSSWLKRLDNVGLGLEDEQAGSQLYVYSVENGEATDLANLLGQIFGGSDSTTSSPTTSGSSAPGLGQTELSSTGSAVSSQTSRSGRTGSTSTETLLGTRIVADEVNNSLLIMAAPKEWRSIRSALDKMDKLPAQVLVEVSIWEVTLKDELDYGVEWFFNSKGGVDGLGDKGGLLSMNDSGSVGRSVPGFSYLFSGSDWRAVINMLASRSNVKSLSSPSVLVQDNREASIQVGNQQPIQTSQTVNTNNTGVLTQNVELKDTGVQLTVKPRVNSGGLVVMDIMQEVTDIGALDTATGQRSFLKRSIESTVAIQSGDTIILGGLIQDSKTDGDSGIPYLSKLPFVGALFGTKGEESNRTELLVTISPTAINQYSDFTKVGDEFRDKMQGLTEAFRDDFEKNADITIKEE
ncbi:MAG: type II secretion system secretin GspD [Pseudomonas sp.]|nr:type II secretion system secretin GspD [Pseudomonas sp.]